MERTGHQMHRQQHGQQQHQHPSVIIVQQPIVVGQGGLFRGQGGILRGQPYLRRGVKLNNGMAIAGSCISCLGVFGFFLVFLGLIFTIVGVSTFMGIIMMLIGGGMLAAGFKFCHKAKQDYDALPQDHPDRVIYGTPAFNPNSRDGSIPISTTAAYQFPPGTQIITAPAMQGAGGQPLINYQLPHGAQIINPSATGQPGGPYHRGSIILTQQQGAMPISPTYADDKPPSYEEVCKDGVHQQSC